MAEIQFRVETDWQEVQRLVRELDALQSSLSNVNTGLPSAEVDKLNNKLTDLKDKYSEVIAFANRANADLSDIFSKRGGIGGTEGDISKGIETEMQKIQSSVGEAFSSILSKVDDFKRSIAEAFGTMANLKENFPSVSVFGEMTEKVAQLNTEADRQKVILADQSTQLDRIAMQRQQETSSLVMQGSEVQTLTEDARKRIDVETEVGDGIDKNTAKYGEQTNAIKESTEAIRENKEAMAVSSVPKVESYTEELERLIVAKRKEIDELKEKAMSVSSGSMLMEGVNNAISAKYKELDELTAKLENIRGNISLDELQNDFNTLTSSIEETKKSMEGLSPDTAEYETLDSLLKSEEEQLEHVKNKMEALREEEGQLGEATNNVAESGKALWGEFSKTDNQGNVFTVIAANAQKADEKVKATEQALKNYPRVYEEIQQKLEQFQNQFGYGDAKIGKFITEAEKLKESLKGVEGAAAFKNGEAWALDAFDKLDGINIQLDGMLKREEKIAQEHEESVRIQEAEKAQAEQRAQSSMRMRTQIMNAREEMARLIAEGKKGTPEFTLLAEKAGDMRDNMQKASATLNYYADNQRSLHALKTGLQGVAGAASLVTGVMGLFNEDSKKMLQIQTQIQSVLGVVVGLEMTYNLVKKESFFRLAAEEVVTWAVAKARGVEAVATEAATAAQEKLNVAMMKNPYGAIAVLLITLAAAIYGVVKALSAETEEEKKAKEARKKAAEERKKEFDDWAKAAAGSVAKQMMSYRKLQDGWKKLHGDLKAQKKYIKDNQKAFNELGWSVKTVTDAENLLVNNTDAVVNAIMARAKAAAYEKVMQDKYEKEVEKRLQEDREGQSVKNGGSVRLVRAGDENYYKSEAFKNAKKAGYTAEKGDFDGAKLTEKGVQRVMEFNRKYAAEQRKLYNQRVAARRKAADKEMDIVEKNIEKEMKADEMFRKKTGVAAYKPTTKGNDKEEKDIYKRRAQMIEDEQKYQDELEEIRRNAERSRIDAQIARIKDDGERERKAREEQHRRNIEDIELQQNEIYKKIYQKRKEAYEQKGNKIPYELTLEGMQGWRGIKENAQPYLAQQTVKSINAEGLREIGFNDEQIEDIKRGKLAADELTKAFEKMQSVSDEGFNELKENIDDLFKKPKEIGVKVKAEGVKEVLTSLSAAFPNQKEEVVKIIAESTDIDDAMRKLRMFVDYLQKDAIVSIQQAERALLTKAGKGSLMETLDKLFGNGNVDIVARPFVDAAEMVNKGWEEAGEGISTVYSRQQQVKDAQGNTHEVLFTPILPDGTILSPQELDKYIANALDGAEDILKADKKGIVIAVDVSADGNAGEYLHELHEQLIDLDPSVMKEIQNMYAKGGGNNNFDEQEKALLKAQQKITNANKEKAEKERQRELEKENKERIAALYEYESKYGSFLQRKAATTAKFDQQIADTSDAIQKASLERQKEEALQALNMEEIKSNLDWETVFGDLTLYSTKSLVKLKEKLRTALDASDITAENAKVITDKILEIEERIGSKSNFLESIIPGLKEHNRLVERKVEAEKEYNRLLKEEQERVATMNSKGDVAVQALKKVGVKNDRGMDFDFDEIFQMPQSNFNDLITKLRSMGDEGNAAADKLEDFKTATINATEATEKSTKAKEHKDNLSNLVDGKTTFKDFMTAASGGGGTFGYAQMALKNGESMKELVNTIGLSNTEFGEAVNDFSEGCQGFSQAIQALMSGDVIGAVTGIIKGFQGYGKVIERVFGFSFSGSNEKEHDRIDAELTRSNEHLKNSIDKLKESFDSYNGVEAIEKSDEINEKQEEYNQNLLKKWANDMNYHSAHHSNSYYWEFDQWAQDDFNRTLEKMGSDKRVNGSWESLMTLSPEEMDKIREENADAWEYITSRGKYSWAYDNLNEYANQAHKVEEQTKDLYEKLTQTTEQNVFEDLINDLYNFGDGVDDVAKSVEKRWAQMKNHMVIKNLVSQGMEKDMKKWYDDLAKLQKEATEAKKAGTFNAVEYNRRMKELKKRYDEIYKEGQEQIKEYQDAGIIQDLDKLNYEQQSALGNSIKNISYDQADSLIGIMTSQQILMEQIKTILDEWSRRTANNDTTEKDNLQTADAIGNAVSVAVANGLPIEIGVKDDVVSAFNDVLVNASGTDQGVAYEQAMLGVLDVLQNMEISVVQNSDMIKSYQRMLLATLVDTFLEDNTDNGVTNPSYSLADELMAVIRDSRNGETSDGGESFLDVYGESLVNVIVEHRNIAADSLDILTAMSFHVEEIRDGVVETIAPTLKEMQEDIYKLRKITEDNQ